MRVVLSESDLARRTWLLRLDDDPSWIRKRIEQDAHRAEEAAKKRWLASVDAKQEHSWRATRRRQNTREEEEEEAKRRWLAKAGSPAWRDEGKHMCART